MFDDEKKVREEKVKRIKRKFSVAVIILVVVLLFALYAFVYLKSRFTKIPGPR